MMKIKEVQTLEIKERSRRRKLFVKTPIKLKKGVQLRKDTLELMKIL